MNKYIEKEVKVNRVFDSNIELKENAMLAKRGELFDEWDFEKNDEIGLDVYKVTFGSKKQAWWNCPDCHSDYDASIKQRAGKQKSNCPYCRGLRVNHTNSLYALRPELASEWHPALNDGLTPHDVTLSSNRKVWWLGSFCGHAWDASIGNRVGNRSGCPYCSGNRILIGFNDMWTTNPELASLLADPEDGYKHTQNSNLKVNWKCDGCNNTIKDKDIHTTKVQGLYCLNCSDKSSIGERIVNSLLLYLDVNFKHEISFSWTEGKRYDFYLFDSNTIIEVHGEQHYIGGFERKGGDSLEDNIKNDEFKYNLAKENGIDKYIVIDARKTSYEWIMNSIMSSELIELLDLTDERLRDFIFDINSSKIKDVWNLWNSGTRSMEEIIQKMRISKSSVYRYLRIGRELKLLNE